MENSPYPVNGKTAFVATKHTDHNDLAMVTKLDHTPTSISSSNLTSKPPCVGCFLISSFRPRRSFMISFVLGEALFFIIITVTEFRAYISENTFLTTLAHCAYWIIGSIVLLFLLGPMLHFLGRLPFRGVTPEDVDKMYKKADASYDGPWKVAYKVFRATGYVWEVVWAGCLVMLVLRTIMHTFKIGRAHV